jgi:hypothetical protein
MNLPSGSVKTLDELLDLPHLNVLLRCILTHLDDVCASKLVANRREKDDVIFVLEKVGC